MLASILLNLKAWLVSPSISFPNMGCHEMEMIIMCHRSQSKPRKACLYSFLLYFLCTSSQIAHKKFILIFMTKTGGIVKRPYKNLKWKDKVHSLIGKLLFSSITEFFCIPAIFTFPAAWPAAQCRTLMKPEPWSISSSNYKCASKFPTLSFMPLPLVERIVYSADHGDPWVPLEMCGLVLTQHSLDQWS